MEIPREPSQPLNELVSKSAVADGRAEPLGSTARGYAAQQVARPPARRRWWRDARRRRMLALADLVAAACAAGVVSATVADGAWAFAFLPMWLLVAKLFGLYDRDHRALRHLTADEVPVMIAWAATGTALLALLLPLTPAGTLGALTSAANLAVIALAAIVARSVARRLWWTWTPPETVGLIGEGEAMESMRRKFGLFREMHFELAAEREISSLGGAEERTRALRDVADGVDRIVVASGSVDSELIVELNAICRRRQVKLSAVSPLRGKAQPAPQIAQLADLPILEYNTWDPSRSSLLIKRGFDVAVAGVGMLVLLPLLPLIALAIKLDSRGPILFSQVRAGLGGRPFRMYKFRTMRVDAEEMLDQVVQLSELEHPAFKVRDDPRVTRVGRILRRLSIDELPQLFNVLVGEMSVVGPRPEQVEIVERYGADDRIRLTVKPGVTGPMQIFGRGELTFAERVAVELDYIENPSLARDLRVVLHTIPAVIRGTGAF
jgi:exopolysaccharide biosynthesis polyprenyl glycosylphosphotransferase